MVDCPASGREAADKEEIEMKTTVLAAALIVAAVVPASAFQQATWDGGVNLECAVVKTTEGYKKDDDPIYKIMVELSLFLDRNDGQEPRLYNAWIALAEHR
jgi:hypothetical protein